MGLETGDYLNDLNKLWPLGGDYGSTADDHLRLIKKTLVQSFPNITGAMNATQAELNYMVGVTSSVQDQLDNTLVPVGGIIMFSGTLTNLSANWALCDGSGSTPDLRGQFIMGAADQGTIGDTGGSADAIVVAHTHTGTTASDGDHNHNQYTGADDAPSDSGGAGYGLALDYSSPSIPAGGSATLRTNIMETTGAHTHTFTTGSSGSSGTNANLPPYYKLAYIMRVS